MKIVKNDFDKIFISCFFFLWQLTQNVELQNKGQKVSSTLKRKNNQNLFFALTKKTNAYHFQNNFS